MINVWLSQFIRIVVIGFSTIGKSIKISMSYSTSTIVVYSATSSASMVEVVNMVYLKDLYKIAPPP
jgi:flagellar biosynthesis protein FliR